MKTDSPSPEISMRYLWCSLVLLGIGLISVIARRTCIASSLVELLIVIGIPIAFGIYVRKSNHRAIVKWAIFVFSIAAGSFVLIPWYCIILS